MTSQYPGAYIEEFSQDNHSIKGVNTTTTAFIGVAEKGPIDEAVKVTSFRHFHEIFGGSVKGSWLAWATFQFFNNGGKNLYILRVTGNRRTGLRETDYMEAFALLDSIKDINLIAVPGIGTPTMVSFGADYCERREDCFFIGDMSLTDDNKNKVQSFVNDIQIKNSFVAIYFPWIKIKSPTKVSRHPVFVPPSGSVTGIFARNDINRGVWKTPAGAESQINGAIELSGNIPINDQNLMNSMGVNVIKTFSNTNILIWGGRTLAADSDEFKYIAIRRFSIFIRQSIYHGTKWAVFEPNDEPLWLKVQMSVEAFLYSLFQKGAFQGSKPEDAYFVKCDHYTNSPNDINAGNMNILVGFAPVRPAEFIIIKIQQITTSI